MTIIRWTVALALVLLLAGCGDDDDDGSRPMPTPTPVTDEEGHPFDLATALELGRLCLQSYQMLTDYEQGDSFTLPAPYTLRAQFLTAEHFPGEDFPDAVPIAYVATSGTSIYVVFRGTKTIAEWVSDATLTQEPYTFVAGGGETETGFTAIYASLNTGIIDLVNSLAQEGTYDTLYITGHSLGAALATLAAPDLARATPFSDPVLYNFASPRTGNPVFALLVDELPITWRIANTNDEVPRLPPAVTVIINNDMPEFLFYEHIDTAYDVTFGGPIHSVSDLENNHAMCNYYGTLCDQTADPTACKAMVAGVDDCTPS